jgi:hypothetical protein
MSVVYRASTTDFNEKFTKPQQMFRMRYSNKIHRARSNASLLFSFRSICLAHHRFFPALFSVLLDAAAANSASAILHVSFAFSSRRCNFFVLLQGFSSARALLLIKPARGCFVLLLLARAVTMSRGV